MLRASLLLEDAALDKYRFTRDLYLNRRQSPIGGMIDKGIGLGDLHDAMRIAKIRREG